MTETYFATEDLESALIAGCLVDPTRIDKASSELTGRDFEDLGSVWDMLVTLRESGRDIGDAKLLLDSAKRFSLHSKFHTVGGWSKLIGEGMPHNVPYYANEIRKSAMVRRQKRLIAEASMRLNSPSVDPSEFAQWLSATLDSMSLDMGHGSQHIADLLEAVIADSQTSTQRSEAGIMSGFVSLDNALGKIRAGELCVIAGRPGDGKTALACQIAVHNALKQRPVWFASLEMQTKEVASRILCGHAGVSSHQLRRRAASDDELKAMVQASCKIGPTPLWLWKRPYCTWPKLRAEARIISTQHKTAMIVVDYLAKIEKSDGRTVMHEHLGETVRKLKSLASELECVVVLLAQSNRVADGERPKLSHLAGSADVEREADQVIFCYCDVPKDKRGTNYQVEIIIEKNRHGPTPSYKFDFDGQTISFSDPNEAKPDPFLADFNNRVSYYEGSELP